MIRICFLIGALFLTFNGNTQSTLGIAWGKMSLSSLKKFDKGANPDSVIIPTLLAHLPPSLKTGITLSSKDVLLGGKMKTKKKMDFPQPESSLPIKLQGLKKNHKHAGLLLPTDRKDWLCTQHQITLCIGKVSVKRPFWTRIFEPKRREIHLTFDIYDQQGMLLRGGKIVKGFRPMKGMNPGSLHYILSLVAADLAKEVVLRIPQ